MRGDIINFLETGGNTLIYEKGGIIFRQGDAADVFYYMDAGLSLTYVTCPDGGERNLLITWPGRFFGASTFFRGTARGASAVALEKTRVVAIDRALYQAAKNRFSDFEYELLKALSGDIATLFDQQVDSSLSNSDLRVARFIHRRIALGQCSELGGLPRLTFTQDLIANVLGLSRWSVNKALSAFRENGWLQTNKGSITIIDPEAISRFAYGDAPPQV